MSELVKKDTSTTELSEAFWDFYVMAAVSLLVCNDVFKGMLSAHICSFKDTYIQKPFPTPSVPLVLICINHINLYDTWNFLSIK